MSVAQTRLLIDEAIKNARNTTEKVA